MKFNWGLGITLVMTGFVGFMAFLAYECTQIPSYLVREDYYEASLKTDEVLAAQRRGASLPTVRAFAGEGNTLMLQLPTDCDVNTRVEITAYFANDPSLDWEWSGTPTCEKEGKFIIELPQKHVTCSSGKHHIQWVHQGKSHMQDFKIATALTRLKAPL